MGKILDNPKEFLDSLTDNEFINLLEEYEIKYTKVYKENDVLDNKNSNSGENHEII